MIDSLRSAGFALVQDLATFDVSDVSLSEEDSVDLSALVSEIHSAMKRRSVCMTGSSTSSGSLSPVVDSKAFERALNAQLMLLGENVLFDSLPVKNTFIDYRPTNTLITRSCPPCIVSCDFQVPEPESVKEPPAFLSLFNSLNNDNSNVSPGSLMHSLGHCKPCAWYHHSMGCRYGSECEYCHLCDAGELKKRKKEKVNFLKFLKSSKCNESSSPSSSTDATLGWIASVLSESTSL